MQKKFTACFLLVLMAVFLVGCKSTLKGEDALIEKAREEFPLAGKENLTIQYGGLCTRDDVALLWFYSGDEQQGHTYLPMECRIVGEDEYEYVRTYKPMDRGEDIRVLQWKGGYAFFINNPDCVLLQIGDHEGQIEIPIEEDDEPYIFYKKTLPTEYEFLDAEGNSIS